MKTKKAVTVFLSIPLILCTLNFCSKPNTDVTEPDRSMDIVEPDKIGVDLLSAGMIETTLGYKIKIIRKYEYKHKLMENEPPNIFANTSENHQILDRLIEHLGLISENGEQERYIEYERILKIYYPNIFDDINTFEQIKNGVHSQKEISRWKGTPPMDEDKRQKRARIESNEREFKRIENIHKIIDELEQYKFSNYSPIAATLYYTEMRIP
jgi:hypothetical protein